MLCEVQLVSARIWTRVAVSISYDGNHDESERNNVIGVWTCLIWDRNPAVEHLGYGEPLQVYVFK